jgi:hypothetical protein
MVIGVILASIGAVFAASAIGHKPVYGEFNAIGNGGTAIVPQDTWSASRFATFLAIGFVLAIIGVTTTIAGLIDYARRSG